MQTSFLKSSRGSLLLPRCSCSLYLLLQTICLKRELVELIARCGRGESVVFVQILSLNDQHHLLVRFHVTCWLTDMMIAACLSLCKTQTYLQVFLQLVISALAFFCTDPGKLKNLRMGFFSSLKLCAAPDQVQKWCYIYFPKLWEVYLQSFL